MQNIQTDRCCICLSEIVEKTKIKQCNHIFCFECIDNWTKNSKNNCPLCKVLILEIEKEATGEIIQVLEPKKPNPENVEVELSCLDNKFFLEEIDKLLSISHSIVLQMESLMSKDNNKVYVTPSMNRDDTEKLNSITDRLYSLQKSLENYENAFDPEDLLSTFYIFESSLTDLKVKYLSEFLNNNRYNRIGGGNGSNGNGKHVYIDQNDGDYDDDDDYYDESDETEASIYYNQIDNNSSRTSKLNFSSGSNSNSSNNNNNNKSTPSRR